MDLILVTLIFFAPILDKDQEPVAFRQELKNIENSTVDLQDYLRLDCPFPKFEDQFSHLEPEALIIHEYRGLEGLIRRRVTQRINSWFSKHLKNHWEESYLNDMDLWKAQRSYDLSASDWNFRWWERTWLASLEDGGQKRTAILEGQVNYLDLGFLKLSNEGKFSLDSWDVSFDEASSATLLNQSNLSDLEETLERDRLGLKVTTPGGNLYQGRWFSVAANLRFSIRPPSKFSLDSLDQNRSSVRLNLVAKSFYNKKGKPWLVANLRTTVQPFREEFACQLVIEIYWD